MGSQPRRERTFGRKPPHLAICILPLWYYITKMELLITILLGAVILALLALYAEKAGPQP